MDEVLLATGFTGALTLVFLFRALCRRFGWMPAVSFYFSPKGGCTEAVIRELERARRQILVQAYSFTSDAITNGLVEARKRGVDVEVLLDRSNETERYSDLHIFLENGLHPLIDAHHAIAHNKIMIIDRRTLITGSFNFTNQAEHENAENLLVIKGHPELVQAYCQNFAAHKSHCQPAQVKAPAESHGNRHQKAA
jgi:phosphatidylserine/phosphatidylglycerophosphate/cardiolipin synthase-like enzyme